MVALARGSCLKLLAITGFILGLVVVLHQVSYTNTRDITLTNQPIEILDRCPPSNLKDINNLSTNTTIPNIIHQIWKTADVTTYPAQPSHESWKAMFEPMNYTVRLWTDEDVLALIKNNYTWLLSTYEGYLHNIQRADLARLIVIHSEGGIYADLDVHPRSVEELMCLQQLGLQGIFGATGGNAGMSNHFFMAEKGSDFLQWALEEAKRRGGAASKRILLPYLRVFWSTGPLMLTSVFRQYVWMYGELKPQVALLDETYARKVFGHAAGRSWHGSDGRLLNYVSDHVQVTSLLIVFASLGGILALVCLVRRRRGEPGGVGASFCCRGKPRYDV
ncbi:mipc synthase [Colletotrichum plurivorum]|uniref:Mipc synthase n=1 Tax=Colletotrichum plurivorum TaxID=2175906 RepID=A0A8H6KHP0_9PEZI|nr:mipc synthase [Colletotrichum plurivorum]